MGAFFAAIIPLSAGASDLATKVISEMNLARTSPQTYARIVAGRAGTNEKSAREAVRFLKKQLPLPALAVSEGMENCAESHVRDKGRTGGRGHRGGDRSQPWDRLARFGQWFGRAGENIDYGVRDARGIVVRWIVDEGVRGRGHRRNIFSRDFGVAGAATGHHATHGSMCVANFASAFTETSGRVASRPGQLLAPL